MKKKLIVLIIIMLVIVPTIIYAYGGIDTDITIGRPSTSSSVKVTNRIVGVLQVAGTIISIVALIIIGIRYMISSVDEQAKLKGVLWYYAIGAVLVLAASNCIKLFYDILTTIDK